ncbi:MAG: hypothetical protein ACP5I8_16675 [Phycisphaerae bacterium]
MNRRRGFFIFDLTLAIVLLLAIASMFARLMWLYNRDSVRLATIRDTARVEQASLYRVMSRSPGSASKQWLIKPARMASHAGTSFPPGSQWIVIRSANKVGAPALYALRFAGTAPKKRGGK